MIPTEIKIAVALIGVLSAFVGAFTSAVLFFWREGRRRYLEELSGLRTLLILCEFIIARLTLDPTQPVELKPDWFMVHADVVLHNSKSFKLADGLVKQAVEAQSVALGSAPDLTLIIQNLDRVKRGIDELIQAHSRSLRRILYLV